MSSATGVRKAVTPGSVKILMLVEAGIIGFLSFWVTNEYFYNAYFRSYIDQILIQHITTYTAAFGLGIGLAGTAVAAMFYKNLQRAKIHLENVTAPRIRGAVEKALSGLPVGDTHSVSSIASGATESLKSDNVPADSKTAVEASSSKVEESKTSSE